MAEDVKAHIFEPFLTTKGVDKGTGLGLASYFSIAKETGGGITAYSQSGQGTDFHVYLPEAGGLEEESLPGVRRNIPVEGTRRYCGLKTNPTF